jgi:hypothetical protein
MRLYLPKPYTSLVAKHNTHEWEPPVPYPNDGKMYLWDEEHNLD